jgi:hypothetical protein
MRVQTRDEWVPTFFTAENLKRTGVCAQNQGGRGGGGGGGHRGVGGGGGGGGHHGRQSAPMPAGPDIAIQKTDNAWQIGQTKDEKEKLMRVIKGCAFGPSHNHLNHNPLCPFSARANEFAGLNFERGL